jgi:hypothetical protein
LEPSLIAAGLAGSLRPILRNTAHQLTLLGLVADELEFERVWMSIPGSYHGLGGMTLMQLAEILHSVEFGLGLQVCLYQYEWEDAVSDRDRWQARVRLSAVRLLVVQLRRWKRHNGWQAAFD